MIWFLVTTVMIWFLVIVCATAVSLEPAWKEVAEHATLADLLEQIWLPRSTCKELLE